MKPHIMAGPKTWTIKGATRPSVWASEPSDGHSDMAGFTTEGLVHTFVTNLFPDVPGGSVSAVLW